MVDQKFHERSHAFLQEFQHQPHSQFHPNLQIADLNYRGAGRGIVASADIPPDTVLFTIPRDYVISVEKSALAQKLPQLFLTQETPFDNAEDDDDETLPVPWLNLILVLIHDYLHYSTSRWRAYWDVLPAGFDTLMFWSDAETAELQASAVRGRIGRDSADKMFRERILPVVKEHAAVFFTDANNQWNDDKLLALAHQMGSLIMAYAFDLETSNQDSDDENDDTAEDGWAEDKDVQVTMGMVPMADMLNADAEFNAHLEHGTDQLTMRSLRTIKAGEEVLNYYGPLPNCDLLRRYGYTTPKHARYDVVELSWQSIASKIQEIHGDGIRSSIPTPEDPDETFVLERETGDPDETGLLPTTPAKFTTFPEELVDTITVPIAAHHSIDPASRSLTDTQKKILKKGFLDVMSKVVAARLAEYKTTIEEDEAVLLNPGVTARLKMAVDVRLGEKRLLREVAELVSQLLVKYSEVEMGEAGDVGREDRPAKRQKRSR